MSVGEKIRTLFHLFVLFTVLVAVALISAITTIRLAIRGRQTLVPNLVGMSFESAERLANGRGLDLKVEDKLYSDLPADRIVSQLPPAGTPMKTGQHLHVLVSLGPPHVTVPDLVGSTLRAAQISALQRGLNMGDVAEVHWSGGDPDEVMAQDPPPAATGLRSPAVNFLVSLGEATPSFVCPNFVGRPLTEARHAIEKAGFKVGQVVTTPSEGAVSGIILYQTPSSGSKIDAGTVFDFQVAQ